MDNTSKPNSNSGEQFDKLCSYLIKKFSEDDSRKRSAKTREVLALVGRGMLMASLILAPKYTRFTYFKDENNPSWAEFNRYSKYYNLASLKRTLKRLERQKMVVVRQDLKEQSVELTDHGKKRVLKYAIDEFDIRKPDKWDGKWRLIIYDVADKKKGSRDILRSTLKTLGFLQLQKSVYLFPHPCGQEIEFLRAYYGLNKDVTMLVTSKIENDEAYRQYFGI